MSNAKNFLDINDIKEFLPHRYPFLLVDRVLEYSDEHVVAIKNVTANEAYFMGHFPDNPVMPGVIMVEAMAQASCFLCYNEIAPVKDKKELEVFFLGIEKLRFRKVVTPGDQLKIDIKLTKRRKDFWWVDTRCTVMDDVACEGSISAVLTVKDRIL